MYGRRTFWVSEEDFFSCQRHLNGHIYAKIPFKIVDKPSTEVIHPLGGYSDKCIACQYIIFLKDRNGGLLL